MFVFIAWIIHFIRSRATSEQMRQMLETLGIYI